MIKRIGISIYSIPDHSIDILLDFAQRHNYDAIELWSDLLPASNKRLSEYTDNIDAELSVHAPLLQLGSKKKLEENKSILIDLIQRSYQWKVKKIVLHTGSDNEVNYIKEVEVAADILLSILDLLKERHICLCIENLGYLGNNIICYFNRLADFVDRFPREQVGVTFDLAHANISGGIRSGIDILGDRIKHIHVADNIGVIDNHHMPLGKGKIDFRSIWNIQNINDINAILEITPDGNWQKHLLDGRKFLSEMTTGNHNELLGDVDI
jgi:sugar phosphate isomerase/epimerase